MLIEGDVRSNRFEVLVDNYVRLINNGVSSSSILVILKSSDDKNKFIENVLDKITKNSIEDLKVYTFNGLVYNAISDNWNILEGIIPAKKHFILPNLVGLEVSQFILKDILKNIKVKGYNSKKSLLHQIFRRYLLIIQNDLTDDEVTKKSNILKEAFAEDANHIIKKLMSKTLIYRSFDYIRQLALFKYIYKNTDYFKNIKYLFLDDADEMTPVVFNFLSILNLTDNFIAYDPIGNSRCGYLSADMNFRDKLLKIFNQEPIKLESNHNTDSEILYHNVIEEEKKLLKNFTYETFSRRSEMINSGGIEIIKALIKQGVQPSEITIISPVIDEILKFTLKDALPSVNIQFLSGSQKIIDSPIVKNVLNIFKLSMDIPLNEFDIRSILSEFLNIPIKNCKKILKTYTSTHTLTRDFENDKYQKLLDLIDEVKESEQSFSQKIFLIYQELVDYIEIEQIDKFNFFIKQIQDFEKVFSKNEINTRCSDIINQIENSIISENPYSYLEIDKNDLLVSTPQKIIDSKIISKYQIWLDTSNHQWKKNDVGPLYNSWAFQKDWSGEEYTIEDDIFYAKQKTAKILRKLALCTDYIYAFSSLFDSQGQENFDGIDSYFITEEKPKEKSVQKTFAPRDDQKPVLEYSKGNMAISAVPGAGKTTILLALILKLLKDKINPENIFVLTYMESAARNFKDRIKKVSAPNAKLPNITTIHGLALRILKENGNYKKIGLDEDFDICDDSQRGRLIGSISVNIDKNDVEDFIRGISTLKFAKVSEEKINNIITKPCEYNIHPRVRRFLRFYQEYQIKLREENIIDYDDILVSAVNLLEENEDIRLYYQERCEYIIEDEAQDSSEVQQRLIKLLSGKHKNVIRCGDINQAITTTFTNADVEGFYDFIENADKKVSMNSSQRCSKDVWQLANKLVKYGNNLLDKSFYPMMMAEVVGKNPICENGVQSQIFDTMQNERNFILSEIKKILKLEPQASVGILLRNNYQVAEWEGLINNAGFKVITRSESLGKKAIFKTIFAILKFIAKPFSSKTIKETFEVLSEQGFYKGNVDEIDKDFICKTPDEADSLSQFLWDLHYWLTVSTSDLAKLAIKIGLCYYKTDLEIANVYLISVLIERLNIKNDLHTLIEKLSELSKRPNLSGFKFFSEEDEAVEQTGTIQIMTYHKSKGDEFEYVFLPEFSETNLSLDIERMKLKSSNSFTENIKALNLDYKPKTENGLKEFLIAENLRLLYVAITRAKRRLYFSTSQKIKSFGKMKDNEISIIFEELL